MADIDKKELSKELSLEELELADGGMIPPCGGYKVSGIQGNVVSGGIPPLVVDRPEAKVLTDEALAISEKDVIKNPFGNKAH